MSLSLTHSLIAITEKLTARLTLLLEVKRVTSPRLPRLRYLIFNCFVFQTLPSEPHRDYL